MRQTLKTEQLHLCWYLGDHQLNSEYQLQYFLFKFLEFKNWEWSLSEFFADANVNFASSMLSADLGVAAMAFFIFIIYAFKNQPLKLLKYTACMFLVGFSLAMPVFLYDNYKKFKVSKA